MFIIQNTYKELQTIKNKKANTLGEKKGERIWKGNRINGCSISLVIMEIRIQLHQFAWQNLNTCPTKCYNMLKHREMPVLIHCQKGYELLWPLQQQFDSTLKIKMCISYDPTVILFSVYPGEVFRHRHREITTRMFIPILVAKWKTGKSLNVHH